MKIELTKKKLKYVLVLMAVIGIIVFEIGGKIGAVLAQ